ncbi:SNF2 family DNA-dependent ATPase domain-containing protein, partial [Aureobasidium melanogenum]
HVPPSKLPIIAVVVQGEPEAGKNAFSLADGERIAVQDFERLRKTLSPAQRVTATEMLSSAKADVDSVISEATLIKKQRDVRIKSAAAAAIVALKEIPKKPQATIKGLMDSVKDEENFELQKRSAAAIASLVDQLVAGGRMKVVDKVVGNLVKFCCMETGETPEFHPNADRESGILSLQKDEDIQDRPDAAKYEREVRQARITRRGTKDALEQLCFQFGSDLFGKVPMLRTLIEEPIRHCFSGELPANITDPEQNIGQEVVDAMSTLRALVASFHVDLHPFVLDLMGFVARALQTR